MAARVPNVPVGTVIEVAERDYCFGRGLLRLRVTEVVGGQYAGGERWLVVRGIEILWNGCDGAVREVSVRLSALRRAPGPDTERPAPPPAG